MTGRTVAEWIGRTPDSKVPAHVRARIFVTHGGTCYLSGRKIGPADVWELEHVTPLSMGGMHCESNLRPALRDKHKVKTAAEATVRAKADRVRAKHLGITRPKKAWPSRPFAQSTYSNTRHVEEE